MKKLIPFCVLIVFCYTISAQIGITSATYCQPGVANNTLAKGLLIELGHFSPHSESTPLRLSRTFSHINLKLKAPLVLRENLQVILGADYFRESLNNHQVFPDIMVDGGSDLPDYQDLKATRFTMTVSRPLNTRHYLIGRLEARYAGNHNKSFLFKKRYATYSAIGLYGIKKNALKEHGVGIFIQSSPRTFTILPFIFYNQTFNQKWGIEFASVKFTLRHNLNPDNMMLLSVEYEGAQYGFEDFEEYGVDYFKRANINVTFGYETRVKGWTAISFHAGYRFAFSSKTYIIDEPKFQKNKVEYGSGIFASVGFFLTPPRQNRFLANEGPG